MKGLREIKISNPEYTTPPGDWFRCRYSIFSDSKNRIPCRPLSLNDVENYNGFVNGKQIKK